ncbi:hypothetical protein [Helicobacter sp. 12S02232-10]|uniref:hypothetical protein n=1 Tax=Helicobacter sp. 12S02232-10 TaxID=1476197 RepID=UPI0015DEFC39|nr:hypothetical protein [Helicobacter sp. 12S02232-10]
MEKIIGFLGQIIILGLQSLFIAIILIAFVALIFFTYQGAKFTIKEFKIFKKDDKKK